MRERRSSVVAMGLLVVVGLAIGSACNVTVETTPDGDATSGTEEVMDTSNLAVFVDPDDTTFSTSDVRDVDGEIVRFDLDTESMIWTADETSHGAGMWTVSGNLLMETSFFQVAFGSEGGEPRAYFTETSTGTICDISLFDGDILIVGTSTPVPQN